MRILVCFVLVLCFMVPNLPAQQVGLVGPPIIIPPTPYVPPAPIYNLNSGSGNHTGLLIGGIAAGAVVTAIVVYKLTRHREEPQAIKRVLPVKPPAPKPDLKAVEVRK